MLYAILSRVRLARIGSSLILVKLAIWVRFEKGHCYELDRAFKSGLGSFLHFLL